MKKTKKGIVVCLLAAALLVSMVGMASAASSQSWYLSSTTSDGNEVMYKGSQDGGIDDVTVAKNGGYVIWLANESAQCDVGFPAGDWPGHLKKGRGGGKIFSVAIGVWDGSSFTAITTIMS